MMKEQIKLSDEISSSENAIGISLGVSCEKAQKEIEKIHSIFENSIDGILIVDLKTKKFVMANSVICRFLGFREKEILKLGIPDIHPQKQLPMVMDQFTRLVNKKIKTAVAIPCKKKDGSIVYADITMSTVKISGRILVAGFFRDITERLAIDEAKEASELRYRRLFETARDGILILDYKTGRIIDVNPFLVQMLGFPKEKFINKKLWELGFFKDIAKNKANSAKLKKLEYLRYEDLPLRTADGRQIDVEFVSNAYNVGGYKVIQCNIRDITTRRKAEYLAGVSELRYRRLFETAQDGILILDYKTGKVIDVNPFLVQMLGFPKKKFIGKKLWELGFFKDIAKNKINSLELKQNKYIRYEDLPLKTADGRQIDVEFVSNAYNVDGHKVIQCNIRDITERKKAERAKEASDLRYRRLFETAQDGILILDYKTGKVIDVNPFLIDMLGLPKGKSIYKKLCKLVFFNDIIKNSVHSIKLRQLERLNYEYLTLDTADGRQMDVDLAVNAYHIDSQKVIQCNIRDITTRKKAQEELLIKNAILSAQNEAAIEGILAIDPSGKMISHNHRFAQMWKIPDSIVSTGNDNKMLAYAIKQLKQPDIFLKHVRKLYLQTTKTSNDEIEFKDGRIFNRYTSPLKDAFGKHIGRIWFFNDVTESKNAERAIKASEERYRAIFDFSRDAIITMEPPTWIITSANPSAINMFACKNEEDCIGCNLLRFSPKIQPKGEPSKIGLKTMTEKVIKEGSAIFEWTHRRLTGEDFPASVLFNLAKVGNKTFLQATIRDIARQKKVEQSKMELISLASHQLRTPPTGVKWFASMMLSEDAGKINKKQRVYLGEIMQNNQRMIDLVHSLLSASRIELGKFIPKLERTKIPKIVDDVIVELNPQVLEKRLKITAQYEKGLPSIIVDPGHLRIIVLNLINNAVQYTSNNDEIKITAKKRGRYLCINIADTGCGIPSKQQSQIFSQFFRADNAIDKNKNGSGLGLYIVKTLVNSMGGSIEFKSKLKQGTTFFVSVPIKCKIKNIF